MMRILIPICALVLLCTHASAFTPSHTLPDTSLAKRKTVFRSGIVKYNLPYREVGKRKSDTAVGLTLFEMAFDGYGAKMVCRFTAHGASQVSVFADSVSYTYIDNSKADSQRVGKRQWRTLCTRRKVAPAAPQKFKSYGFNIDNLVASYGNHTFDADKQDMIITNIQDSILLDKRCSGYLFSVREKRGNRRVTRPVLQVWCWDRIPLCIRTAPGYVPDPSSESVPYNGVIAVATSIEVNNPIPAERFLPPAGATVIDGDDSNK